MTLTDTFHAAIRVHLTTKPLNRLAKSSNPEPSALTVNASPNRAPLESDLQVITGLFTGLALISNKR